MNVWKAAVRKVFSVHGSPLIVAFSSFPASHLGFFEGGLSTPERAPGTVLLQ